MSKENINYAKHQRSRFKRFVATMNDGTKLQADTEVEVRKKISEYKRKLSGPIKEVLKKEFKEANKPKFDPNTGEPL